MLLRDGQRGAALLALTREIDDATDARIYGAEFRINALVAAGFAHLDADDPAGAMEAFRWALDGHPRNGRALVGLARALAQTSAADEALGLASTIAATHQRVAAGRPAGRSGDGARRGTRGAAAISPADARCFNACSTRRHRDRPGG